jgi:hypothetical protein
LDEPQNINSKKVTMTRLKGDMDNPQSYTWVIKKKNPLLIDQADNKTTQSRYRRSEQQD